MMALPTVPSYWPVALALVAFGALGLRRGWVRELATLGMVLLAWLIVFAFGMTCAIALVTAYLLGTATAIVTTAITVLAFSTIWFVMPLLRRRASDRARGLSP